MFENKLNNRKYNPLGPRYDFGVFANHVKYTNLYDYIQPGKTAYKQNSRNVLKKKDLNFKVQPKSKLNIQFLQTPPYSKLRSYQSGDW